MKSHPTESLQSMLMRIMPPGKTTGTSGTGLCGVWSHELDMSDGRILDTLDHKQANDNPRPMVHQHS